MTTSIQKNTTHSMRFYCIFRLQNNKNKEHTKLLSPNQTLFPKLFGSTKKAIAAPISMNPFMSLAEKESTLYNHVACLNMLIYHPMYYVLIKYVVSAISNK